jgi:hypothetical protein
VGRIVGLKDRQKQGRTLCEEGTAFIKALHVNMVKANF